jgi:hypothetical protein
MVARYKIRISDFGRKKVDFWPKTANFGFHVRRMPFGSLEL